jgi:hypothetical protein
MTDARPVKPSDGASQREHYSHGYDPKMVAYLETRSARKDAALLVPHLRAGMSLLDCGCGPGALTADLAQLVAPGQVVGIDIAPEPGRPGRGARAEARRLQCEVSDGKHLRAAFSGSLVRRRVRAHGAAAPGGPGQGPPGDIPRAEERRFHRCPGRGYGRGRLCALQPPTRSVMGSLHQILAAQRRRPLFREASPCGAPRVRIRRGRRIGLLRGLRNPPATRWCGEVMARYIPSNLETAVRLGWADADLVERIGGAWKEWGAHPDAFLGILRCEAVGWRE